MLIGCFYSVIYRCQIEKQSVHLFIFSFLEPKADIFPIKASEIYHNQRQAHKHIPIRVGYNVIKQLQYRIFGFDGIHIIDLDQISRIIQYVIGYKILVQSNIDKMNNRIYSEREKNCGSNAFDIFFDEIQSKHQKRYSNFQQMREEVEHERPTENFKIRLRSIDNQGKKCTKTPKQKQIVQNFASCPNGKR